MEKTEISSEFKVGTFVVMGFNCGMYICDGIIYYKLFNSRDHSITNFFEKKDLIDVFGHANYKSALADINKMEVRYYREKNLNLLLN